MSLQEALGSYSHVNHVRNNTSALYIAFCTSREDHVLTLVEHGADMNRRIHSDCQTREHLYVIEAASGIRMVRLGIRLGACQLALSRTLVKFAMYTIHRNDVLYALIDAGARPCRQGDGLYFRHSGYQLPERACVVAYIEPLLKERAKIKRSIVTFIALCPRCTLLRSVGRDVVALIAAAWWAERVRE